VEEEESYYVEITPEAEFYYIKLLEFLHSTHTQESAFRKGDEVLNMAMSLDRNPNRGAAEKKLKFSTAKHRFLLYKVSKRHQVKIIYFVDEHSKKVYVTDFFGTQMDDDKIFMRNK